MRELNRWIITRHKILSNDELGRLIDLLTTAKDLALQRGKPQSHIRDYFIIRSLLETGLRVLELVSLRVSDIHGRSLTVRRGKGGKARTVLLTRSAQRMFKELLNVRVRNFGNTNSPEEYLLLSERNKQFSTRGIRKRVKYWFKRAGVREGLSCHACRHTYISHALASGLDLATVRQNAGHTSLATTSIYTHLTRDDLGDLEIYNSSDFLRKGNNSKPEPGESQ